MTMSDHMSKFQEESWKYEVLWSIFGKLWGVWNCGQTLSWEFDLSSQLKLKLERKSRNKMVKIPAYQDKVYKHHRGHDFFCINLMNFYGVWESALIRYLCNYLSYHMCSDVYVCHVLEGQMFCCPVLPSLL